MHPPGQSASRAAATHGVDVAAERQAAPLHQHRRESPGGHPRQWPVGRIIRGQRGVLTKGLSREQTVMAHRPQDGRSVGARAGSSAIDGPKPPFSSNSEIEQMHVNYLTQKGKTMKQTRGAKRTGSMAAALAVLVLAGAAAFAADPPAPADKPAFKPEQLEQILAPIALYPDDLLTQMLMASTYPLELVEADRWVKKNPDVKGEALATALNEQGWDPSVKSLVNFPPVLAMMSENIDKTVKIGDAFLGQQQAVMATIQKLRGKAQETGNLKDTSEQKVIVDQTTPTPTIAIQPTDPQVVYIPSYSPEVYYPTWPYPAYPPAPYYPSGYIAGRAVAFGAGVALGAAWGYAWGHSNWHGGSVNVNVNRNASFNGRINRSASVSHYGANGQGAFKHDASHRQGVSYRNQAMASQYGRTSNADAARARDAFRGRTAGGVGGTGGVGRASGVGGVGGARGVGVGPRPAPRANNNAFSGVNHGGSAARNASLRGNASRAAAPSRSGGGRPAGGGRAAGGGGRSGGGGRR